MQSSSNAAQIRSIAPKSLRSHSVILYLSVPKFARTDTGAIPCASSLRSFQVIDAIRKLVDEHGRMPVSAASLKPDQDLYATGLTSFATVQLMLAIEEHFDLEFPERMLNRRSFASLAAIAACVNEIEPARLAS